MTLLSSFILFSAVTIGSCKQRSREKADRHIGSVCFFECIGDSALTKHANTFSYRINNLMYVDSLYYLNGTVFIVAGKTDTIEVDGRQKIGSTKMILGCSGTDIIVYNLRQKFDAAGYFVYSVDSFSSTRVVRTFAGQSDSYPTVISCIKAIELAKITWMPGSQLEYTYSVYSDTLVYNELLPIVGKPNSKARLTYEVPFKSNVCPVFASIRLIKMINPAVEQENYWK